MMQTFRPAMLAILVICGVASGAVAQSLFAPVATVGERVVTGYELSQRARMLELFGAPGDPEEGALTALVNERLQLAEAERIGVEVTEQEVLDGMSEFAARADAEREEFVRALAADGVDEATFRDFVRAGIAWRKLVRARFAGQVAIAEDVVEREITGPPSAELRVLLNEIILPANTPERAAEAERLAAEITRIGSFDAFSAAARDYSASPSRDRGGQLDWLPVANLPPEIRGLVTALQPGEVAGPVQVPNALALFQLRAIEEVAGAGEVRTVDFAALYLPGGRSPETLSRAAGIAAETGTCEELFGAAREISGARVQRDALPPAEIPTDVALELAGLDDGEISTGLTRADGRTLVVLMLCERSYADPDAETDRAAVRNQLTNQRVSRLADGWLAELRANATISYR